MSRCKRASQHNKLARGIIALVVLSGALTKGMRRFISILGVFFVLVGGSYCWGFLPIRPACSRAAAHGRSRTPTANGPFFLDAERKPKQGAVYGYYMARDKPAKYAAALSARGQSSDEDEEEEAVDPRRKSLMDHVRRRVIAYMIQHRVLFAAMAMAVVVVAVAVRLWPIFCVALRWAGMAAAFIKTTISVFLRELWRSLTCSSWQYEAKYGQLPPGANPETYGKGPWRGKYW